MCPALWLRQLGAAPTQPRLDVGRSPKGVAPTTLEGSAMIGTATNVIVEETEGQAATLGGADAGSRRRRTWRSNYVQKRLLVIELKGGIGTEGPRNQAYREELNVDTMVDYTMNSEGLVDSGDGTGQYNREDWMRDHTVACTVTRFGDYVNGMRRSTMAARAICATMRARPAHRQRRREATETVCKRLALTSASNAECCACNPGRTMAQTPRQCEQPAPPMRLRGPLCLAARAIPVNK